MKSRISKSQTAAKSTAKTTVETETIAKTAKEKVAGVRNAVSKTDSEDYVSERYDAGLLGADDSARLALVELKLPVAAAAPRDDIQAKYHSVLAMEAARKMGRSRQKLRTGQEVCHHLKMMLAIDLSPRTALSRKRASGAEPQFRLGF